MNLSVKMDKNQCGGQQCSDYKIVVTKYADRFNDQTIQVRFDYGDENIAQKGGSLLIDPDVAKWLANSLIAIADPSTHSKSNLVFSRPEPDEPLFP